MSCRPAPMTSMSSESLEGKEYLFPAIPQCILDVNLESQTVTVHILDGLLDL